MNQTKLKIFAYSELKFKLEFVYFSYNLDFFFFNDLLAGWEEMKYLNLKQICEV